MKNSGKSVGHSHPGHEWRGGVETLIPAPTHEMKTTKKKKTTTCYFLRGRRRIS